MKSPQPILPKSIEAPRSFFPNPINTPWCILAHLHPAARDRQRIAHYLPHESELDMSGIEFPVTKAGIKTFEKKNDISIMVLGYENKTFFPFYLCQTEKNIHVNLLLLSDRTQTH